MVIALPLVSEHVVVGQRFPASFGEDGDGRGWKRWAFPLVVVGMNSIAMYCLTHLQSDFIAETLKTHLGQHWAERVSPVYAPIIEQSAVLFALWLAMLWLYRRKLFLRI